MHMLFTRKFYFFTSEEPRTWESFISCWGNMWWSEDLKKRCGEKRAVLQPVNTHWLIICLQNKLRILCWNLKIFTPRTIQRALTLSIPNSQCKFSQPFKKKMFEWCSEKSLINFHLSKLSIGKFSGERLKKKIEVDYSWKWKGSTPFLSQMTNTSLTLILRPTLTIRAITNPQ